MSGRSEFVDMIEPLRNRLAIYDRTRVPTDQPVNDATDPTRAVPQSFIDAMIVREAVYVKEQNVPLENEVDDLDQHSYHWVAYASIPTKGRPASSDGSPPRKMSTTSTKIPIGTIRLVQSGPWDKTMQKTNESYVKLGRLAVIKEFRGTGISHLLINTALDFIRSYPAQMIPPEKSSISEVSPSQPTFHGLVLVHSQVGTQKIWARHGFELDEAMGKWDEEGIEHVGMWKRLELKKETARTTLTGAHGAN